MAMINGQESSSPIGGYANPNVSIALRSIDPSWIGWPTKQADVGTDSSSVVTKVVAAVHPKVVNGMTALSYMDDFYYHVIVDPSSINLGNLLVSQTQEVHLWNGFLEPITIDEFTVSDGDGFTVIPPVGFETAPFTLQPLQEIVYQVTVSLVGPPNIDTTLTWSSDKGSGTSEIVGSRVTIFPFLPNWANGIDETLSARSSVLRAPDGSEQSVTLRGNLRRAYNMPYLLRDGMAQYAENLLFGWQSRIFGVPAWPEQDYITAAVVAGASVISVPTTNKSFSVDGTFMVFSGRDVLNAEVKEILSITATTITTKAPFGADWPKDARIVPILLGAANPQLQGTRHVPSAVEMAIQFDLQPINTPDNAPLVAAPALYRGYEIYLGRTNWRDGLSVNMNTDVIRVDMQTGVFQLVPRSGYSNAGRSHDWFLKTNSDVALFRQWLKRRRGKAVGVWMPSAMEDFTAADIFLSNSLSIKVKTNGYALMVAQHPSRRDIFIRTGDATYSRRIMSSGDNGDGTTTLFIDAVLGKQINPEDIRQFSYLFFYRMASDETTLHWHKPGSAEVTTGLITTEALQ